MKRMPIILAALILLAAGASAQTKTADMTVFGFQLGEKFSLSECARSEHSTVKIIVYEGNDPSPCFEVNRTIRPAPSPHTPVLDDQYVKIHFPTDDVSEMTLNVHAQIIDGKLEGVLISTFGLKTQDETLNALKEKYGTPSDFQVEKMQNGFGAVYQSHLAHWIFEGLTVTFAGTANRVDRGVIAIETTKETEFRRSLREKEKAGPKL
jgi:hypothetical protein